MILNHSSHYHHYPPAHPFHIIIVEQTSELRLPVAVGSCTAACKTNAVAACPAGAALAAGGADAAGALLASGGPGGTAAARVSRGCIPLPSSSESKSIAVVVGRKAHLLNMHPKNVPGSTLGFLNFTSAALSALSSFAASAASGGAAAIALLAKDRDGGPRRGCKNLSRNGYGCF